MGGKKFSLTHRSTMCGLKKLVSGVFPESRNKKCRQNGGGGDGGGGGGDGGGNGPKTISLPITRSDLIT